MNAVDPDGDEVTFSASEQPEGSSFTGSNIFQWNPGYDTVKREGAIDSVLDKFHLLKKSFAI